MATLTQASLLSRKVFYSFVILVILVIVLMIILMISAPLRKSLFESQPVATVAFGKLPRQKITGGFKPTTNIIYTLETVSGDLPKAPLFVKVFAIDLPKHSFGDVERIKKRAYTAGFTNPPRQISEDFVEFVDPKNDQKILTAETSTGNFTLVSDWANSQKVITSKIKNLEDAQSKARDLLTNFGITREEFPEKKVEIKKYRIDGSSLVETAAISQTNLARIIFKRAELDKRAVIPVIEGGDLVWALVADKEIVAASASIARIQKFKFATYPLKDIRRAFEELKAQKATFNKMPPPDLISIRGVSLGYLEDKDTGPYLQPVYMFRSDNNLIAYVPAIDEAWIQ